MLAREVDGTVQGDDGFAGASGARDAGGAAVVAFDEGALRGVQKDGPFLPRKFEGAL